MENDSLHSHLTQFEKIAETTAVECDGMTNIIHYYLSKAGISHTILSGTLYGVVPHFVTVIDNTEQWLDYRARLWFNW